MRRRLTHPVKAGTTHRADTGCCRCAGCRKDRLCILNFSFYFALNTVSFQRFTSTVTLQNLVAAGLFEVGHNLTHFLRLIFPTNQQHIGRINNDQVLYTDGYDQALVAIIV